MDTTAAGPALLHALGGAVHLLPLPPVTGLPFVEIGRLGALPVWSAGDHRAGLATHARRLARSGRLGVLLAADPGGPVLLAVSVAPGRVVAHPPAAIPLLARRIVRALCHSDPLPLAQGVALAEAIDLDAAGRQTFRLLHALIHDGVEQTGPTATPVDRHAWILTQLTRLLFLRFVEREGWLASRPAFLREQFERVLDRRGDPLRHLLQPLFFGTLNRPVAQRRRVAAAFGQIPFLNGGLFEPHPIERAVALTPPLPWWHEVFTAITERIDVTLHSESADGAVTPEMLGRVFEGVMAPDERKVHGTYYTPPHLVQRLLHAALLPVLADRVGRAPERVAEDLLTPDPMLRRACLGLRVLDPAVGSGAFLVGALQLLHGPGPQDPTRTRTLLTRCLHGIDRDPRAVRITELRLWLELLRSLRGRSISRLPPLPNLDTMVRVGDALLDPLHGHPDRPQARRLAHLHNEVTRQHGAARRRAARALHHAETVALREGVAEDLARLRAQREALAAEAALPTLFGEAPVPDPARERELAQLDQQIARTGQELARIDRGEGTPPFSPTLAFAPVLAAGGFDLVVGNPPWVRGDRLPEPLREALRERWSWWRRSGSVRGFRQHPDLAVAFVERSLSLCRTGGAVALLVPAKLATTSYAVRMREAMARQTTLHHVADLTDDASATFEATTYPMAVIALRQPPPANHRVTLTLEHTDSTTAQEAWQHGGPWILRAPDAHRIAARVMASTACIGELVTPALGLKTGANAVFLDPPPTLARWTRPALRGRDLARSTPLPSARLLWPATSHGVPWPELPDELNRYLRPHRTRLECRTDLADRIWWRLFRVRAAVAEHRVVWSDLATALRTVVLDDPQVVPLNSCYVAALPDRATARALAAWCNSTWIRALAALLADPAAQGFRRFNARVVSQLPFVTAAIPALQDIDPLPLDRARQDDLDERVASFLSLSAADRAALTALAPSGR